MRILSSLFFFLSFLSLSLSSSLFPTLTSSIHAPGHFVNSFKDFHSSHHISAFSSSPLKKNNVDTQFFKNSTLDHFSAFNGNTFTQRYFVNTQFCPNPNDCSTAPFVHFILPQEVGYTSDPTLFDQMAEDFHALSVTVESRYYGQSIPHNTYNTSNLRYFTIEQVMEDFVEFQQFIIDTYHLPPPSHLPWLLDGCSYSGALSAWTKSRYPHLFFGSIAGSSVIEARTDFSQYVTEMGNQIPLSCREYIRASSDEIVQYIESSSIPSPREELYPLFHVCPDNIPSDPLQYANNKFLFTAYLFNQISSIVQYGSESSIQQMCDNIMSNTTATPIENMASYMVSYALQPTQCLYVDYWTVVSASPSYTPDDVAFAWQQCTQIGIFQTTEGEGNILPPYFNTTGYLQYCNDLFNGRGNPYHLDEALVFGNTSSYSSLPKTEAFNDDHGSHDIQLTNTLFVNGGQDPYHFLSNWNENQMVGLSGEIQSGNGVLFYEGYPHCSYGQNFTQIEYEYIKKWLMGGRRMEEGEGKRESVLIK